MKGQMKKQNGITLIALVITIIVMLILAGVSINLVAGENGILGKAQSAVLENKKGQILEEAQMLISEWQTDYFVNKVPLDGRSGQTESGADVICTAGQIFVTDNSADGKMYSATYSNEAGLGSFVDLAQDTTSQMYKATHPQEHTPGGYEYVEGTWSTGYVIKETSTEDEFVWIPVVSPESYSKKSGSRNYHNKALNNNETGVDVLSAGFIKGDITGLSTILGKNVSQNLDNVSPEAEVVNNAGGFWVSRYEIGFVRSNSIKDAAITNTFWDSFSASGLKSVAGVEPARYISQRQALNLVNQWKGDNVNYQSGLITGTQWDMVCKFIGWDLCDTGNMNTWGNYYDATGTIAKGHMGQTDAADNANHRYWTILADADTFTKPVNTRTAAATGSFTSTVAGNHSTAQKNIFDIAGNVWEWTTEVPLNGNGANRVLRGGSAHSDGGGDCVATSRHGNNSAGYSVWDIGFRAVLYVK